MHQVLAVASCHQVLPVFVAPYQAVQEVDEIWFHFRFNFRFRWFSGFNKLDPLLGGTTCCQEWMLTIYQVSQIFDLLAVGFWIYWQFEFRLQKSLKSSICYPLELVHSSVVSMSWCTFDVCCNLSKKNIHSSVSKGDFLCNKNQTLKRTLFFMNVSNIDFSWKGILYFFCLWQAAKVQLKHNFLAEACKESGWWRSILQSATRLQSLSRVALEHFYSQIWQSISTVRVAPEHFYNQNLQSISTDYSHRLMSRLC